MLSTSRLILLVPDRRLFKTYSCIFVSVSPMLYEQAVTVHYKFLGQDKMHDYRCGSHVYTYVSGSLYHYRCA